MSKIYSRKLPVYLQSIYFRTFQLINKIQEPQWRPGTYLAMVKPVHFSTNVSLIRLLTNKETTVVHLNSELVLSIAYIELNDALYYLIY